MKAREERILSPVREKIGLWPNAASSASVKHPATLLSGVLLRSI